MTAPNTWEGSRVPLLSRPKGRTAGLWSCLQRENLEKHSGQPWSRLSSTSVFSVTPRGRGSSLGRPGGRGCGVTGHSQDLVPGPLFFFGGGRCICIHWIFRYPDMFTKFFLMAAVYHAVPSPPAKRDSAAYPSQSQSHRVLLAPGWDT